MSVKDQVARRDQQLLDCADRIGQQRGEINRLRDRAIAMSHVIVEAGIVPGIDYPCRCDECRSVAVGMAEAGYLDNVKDRWWETESQQHGGTNARKTNSTSPGPTDRNSDPV